MAQKKTKKVYLLRNTNTGEVEYVGCSQNPKRRLYQHTRVKPIYSKGEGKFYGRTDLEIVVVKEFENKGDALRYEGKLKLQYGFEWTEEWRCPKPLKIYSYKTNELIGVYDSLINACNELNVSKGNLSEVVNGIKKQTKGYYGRYEMD